MEMTSPSRLADPDSGYGWLSIALHWVGAIVVIALWVIGSSIPNAGTKYRETLQLHTSIAALAYALLWFRVIWRFRSGHPAPNEAQRGWAFAVGKIAHFALLVTIIVMLLTGPLTVWLNGEAIHVFKLAIPSPFSVHLDAANLAHRIHVIGANTIILVTTLHIGGALKHAAFSKDGTLDRILVAGKR